MNARTDLSAEAGVQAMSPQPVLLRWVTRWRGRLKSWRRPHQVMLPMDAQALARPGAVGVATQAFEAWAAMHEGAAVELSLSSHGLLMLADDGTTDARALREQAIERWTHYLDLPAEGFDSEWLLRTTVDLGRSPVAVACAVPRALCDGLVDVARRHGVKLLAVQPWWAGGLQQAWQDLPSPDDSGAGQVDASRRWAWREGAWQTQAQVGVDGARWVLRSLAFVTVGDGVQADGGATVNEVFAAPVSDVVSPMALAASLMRPPRMPWAESLNFVGPRVRVSFWSWALLALGLIASVHALDLAGQVADAQEATQAELSRLQAHAKSAQANGRNTKPESSEARTLGSSASRASSVPNIPQLQAEAWGSAAQLAAWLGHPWAAALDHVDATAHQHGIALTRFQLDLGTWGDRAGQALTWRLQAAVPDDATALAWLADLGPQAEWQRRDALPQPVPSARGTLAWRIDVSGAGGQP